MNIFAILAALLVMASSLTSCQPIPKDSVKIVDTDDFITTDTKEYDDFHSTTTTTSLFDSVPDADRAPYECYTVTKHGMTGCWDESEFILVRVCDPVDDKCFAIFEKDAVMYYGVVYKSSSIPDTNSEVIIVPQDVYDELVGKWIENH